MSYPGGKNGAGVYQTIINQIPPHKYYIEGFLGSGAILRLKKPALASLGIDSDPGVIEAWRGAVPNVTLLCANFLDYIQLHPPTPDTFLYLDPPYLLETRSTKARIYNHEFYLRSQHVALLDAVRPLPCPVMISGYPSELYDRLLPGWRQVTYQAKTRAGLATEVLWMNYPEPLELHDYRYLGENYRERERIKRKQNRWRSRLAKMDRLERYALLMAIGEVKSPAAIGKGDAVISGPVEPQILRPIPSQLAIWDPLAENDDPWG